MLDIPLQIRNVSLVAKMNHVKQRLLIENLFPSDSTVDDNAMHADTFTDKQFEFGEKIHEILCLHIRLE